MVEFEKKLLKEKYNNDYNEFYKNEYPASYDIWSSKYRFKDESIEDMWKRIAKAIASVEKTEELQKEWTTKFYKLLHDFKYLPGGRIMSNAGTGREKTTLINCFVENLEDEIDYNRLHKDIEQWYNTFSKNDPSVALTALRKDFHINKYVPEWYMYKSNNQYYNKEEFKRFISLLPHPSVWLLGNFIIHIINDHFNWSSAGDNERQNYLLRDDIIKRFKQHYRVYEADSMLGIMAKASNWALTLRSGGGVGGNFSNLRPGGHYVAGVDSDSSGPMAFMRTFDQICKTVKSAGARRGAMIAIFHINHPDVTHFINAKKDSWDIEKLKIHIANAKGINDTEKKYYKELVDNAKSFTQFNISVGVTNEFMKAVENDELWYFKWNGQNYGDPIGARKLWELITSNTYECSEPGIMFLDRVNKLNPLFYAEDIHASNPCGEQQLSHGSVCCLGSFNLTEFISGEPFTDACTFNDDLLKSYIHSAVRFQDNVLDYTHYPIEYQKYHAMNKRRIGIGITGLADLLSFLNMKYGSEESVAFVNNIMKTIQDECYKASAMLAAEKGSFNWYDKWLYSHNPYFKNLSEETLLLIKKNGVRNSHVGSVQPTGTSSFVAKNISSSLEPIFMNEYDRYVKTGKVDPTTGIEERKLVSCKDFAYHIYRSLHPKAKLPEYFVNTNNLDVVDHLNIEMAIAPYIDSAISKTINIPSNYPIEKFRDVYNIAWKSESIKGITTYRDGSMSGILIKKNASIDEESEDNVKEEAPNRPNVLTGVTKRITEDNNHYYITVNLMEDQPFEIFCITNGKTPKSITDEIYDLLLGLAKKKKIKEKYLKDQMDKGNTNTDKVTRLISLALRHGVSLKSILFELDNLETPIGSVVYHIKKVLGEYIKDGTPVNGGKKCEECKKSDGLIFQSGCVTCQHCGWSKC